MALHREFTMDPKYQQHAHVLTSALEILEKESILTADNSEEIKAFLIKDMEHADKIALALVILKPVVCQENLQKFAQHLSKYGKYADVSAQSFMILYAEDKDLVDKIQPALSAEEYMEEIEEMKSAVSESAPYAAQLFLAKRELESAEPLLQEYLQNSRLRKHAEHAYELVRAMKRLSGILNENNIQTIWDYLVQHEKHAYKFACSIFIFHADKFFDPQDSDFFASKYVRFLAQCPPQHVEYFAYAIKYLDTIKSLDQEHIDMLLNCEHPHLIAECWVELKKADELRHPGREVLFNTANKNLIIKHAKDPKNNLTILYLMRAINDFETLSLDQHNFAMIIRYNSRFCQKILNFFRDNRPDQAALDKFIEDINTAIESQRIPFLLCLQRKAAINSTKGAGRFFREGQRLCKEIFEYLPSPEIVPSSKAECKK